MIDTHCHLTFPELAGRIDEVLRAAVRDVTRMITVGTSPLEVELAAALAERRSQVFFTAGVHPHRAGEVQLYELPPLLEYTLHPRCVALGEMGLDYHYPDPPVDQQHELFNAQLELARYSETEKPIIIHCRKAVDDTLAMLKSSGLAPGRFVFHCFTETPEEARKVLDFGAMISFTGIATYKNAPLVRESAKLAPMDRMMIETDAPYLTPEPHRKIHPNEPQYVADTAVFLAGLKGMELSEFVRQVDANAERFFRLPAQAPLRVVD